MIRKNIDVFTVIIVIVGIFHFQCAQYPAPSLFDPNQPELPQPEITSVVPPDSALSGVGEIMINGKNFSANAGEDLVFFNEVPVEIKSATTTQLIVTTPVLEGDSIAIKVAVQGSELFSDPWNYKLNPAVADFGRIFEGAIAYAIASDAAGNVYYFVRNESVGNEIFKTTPQGETESLGFTSFLIANAMKIGPGNLLYIAPTGRIRKISTFSLDGTEGTYVSLPANPIDLDFDASGNIWVVGTRLLMRVTTDKKVDQMLTFPVNRMYGVRVFDGHVYAGGEDTNTGEKKIWRAEIQGDALGDLEVVLDVANAAWLEGASVLSFTFAEDGEMVLGTDHPMGIFLYRSDGTNEPLYPGLFEPEIYAMSWANGPTLYAVRHRRSADNPGTFDFSQIYKISLSKNNAPYFGR